MEKKQVKHVSWGEFELLIEILIKKIDEGKIEFDSIHGVPRGGIPIAIALASHYKKPILKEPRSDTLIVDDICDSGKTMQRFPAHKKAVLFYKSSSNVVVDAYADKPDCWVEFPWETAANETPGEDAVTRMIQVIGDDPNREGLKETPKRVVKSWKELFAGYHIDTKALLATVFEDGMKECDELVLCKDIEFYSTCEHHMLPIIGKMHIGYIPDKKVVGLSKLARLGDAHARRLQIQEKLTHDIAKDLMEHLKPKGVGVIVTAKHFCMCARGVGKQSSWMTTSSMQGVLRDNPSARAEFLKLCEPS